MIILSMDLGLVSVFSSFEFFACFGFGVSDFGFRHASDGVQPKSYGGCVSVLKTLHCRAMDKVVAQVSNLLYRSASSLHAL